MSIELGKFNQLEVVKEVDFGVYLDGGEEGEILLPTRYAKTMHGCRVVWENVFISTRVLYSVLHHRQDGGWCG